MKLWITAKFDEKDLLESLGVTVGNYDSNSGCFNKCEVSDEGMNKLDSYWGHFIWGSEKVEKVLDKLSLHF